MRPIPIAVALALALAAAGPAAAQEVPARWGPYSVDLVDESGRVLPTFEHRGRSYVLGALGQRYLLRVRNASARRVEVVASVDGRDVVDGRRAGFEKRGYVVAPYGEVTIDGYRLSQASVAAFRFSSVPRSYAARKGDARDVGVVGVAVFPERWPVYAPPPYPVPPPYPYPYPGAPWNGAPGARSGAAPEPSEGRAEAQRAPAPPSAGEAPLADRGSGAPLGAAPAPHRPGLGTEFGEEHESRVDEVSFARASARPEAVLTLRYDDRPGLLALGIDVDGGRWASGEERRLRETARPFRSEPGYCEPPPGWAR
jgi:hypothetical protein